MNAVELIKRTLEKVEQGKITIDEYEEIIEPLKNVEPVVYCKECLYWSQYDESCSYEKNVDDSCHVIEALPDHFCSYGRRRAK